MGILEILKNLKSGGKKSTFDLSVFDDPLASKTSWTPAYSGGANFKTRTLKKISQSELHFVASTGAKFFGLAFLLFPFFFLIIGFSTTEKMEFSLDLLGFVIVPFAFLCLGFFIYRKYSKPIIFNMQSGYFYKGKKNKELSLNPKENKDTFKLEKIKALQLLSEYIRGNKSSYTSYEINLVFEDGSRYNVVDHGHRSSIEKDAITLSNFLGVPLWNQLTSETYLPRTTSSSSSYDSLQPHSTVRSNTRPTYSSTSSDNLDEDYDSTKPRKM